MVIEILHVLLFFKIIWIYQEKKTKEIDSPFHYSIVKKVGAHLHAFFNLHHLGFSLSFMVKNLGILAYPWVL